MNTPHFHFTLFNLNLSTEKVSPNNKKGKKLHVYLPIYGKETTIRPLSLSVKLPLAGLTRSKIEPKSTVSGADALSTRPLFGYQYASIKSRRNINPTK